MALRGQLQSQQGRLSPLCPAVLSGSAVGPPWDLPCPSCLAFWSAVAVPAGGAAPGTAQLRSLPCPTPAGPAAAPPGLTATGRAGWGLSSRTGKSPGGKACFTLAPSMYAITCCGQRRGRRRHCKRSGGQERCPAPCPAPCPHLPGPFRAFRCVPRGRGPERWSYCRSAWTPNPCSPPPHRPTSALMGLPGSGGASQGCSPKVAAGGVHRPPGHLLLSSKETPALHAYTPAGWQGPGLP